MQLANSCPQQAPRAGAYRFVGIWIVELDKEERHVVLPRYPPVALEIDLRYQISVPVVCIADFELTEVGHIVHVPAEDDGAETEAIFGNGEKLLLRDEFTAQNT